MMSLLSNRGPTGQWLWTPMARSASWKESHGAAVLQKVLAGLKPHVPQVLAERLP